MEGIYKTQGWMRSAYRILVRNPEGKRPLGRFRVDGRVM
jgi:hypothetical protein